MRDDFTKKTVDTLAKRAGYFCSNPECKTLTVGSAKGHDGFVIVGVAAHITAASRSGPRYDPNLTQELRRDQSNGIWLCAIHGKEVDSDDRHFAVEMLRKWKQMAEEESFRAIVAGNRCPVPRLVPSGPDAVARDLIETPGLPSLNDLEAMTARVMTAAEVDFGAFKRTRRWPRHAIALNLRMTTGSAVRAFHASALADAVHTFSEIIVIAPPGTGKSTTLLQVVEAILWRRKTVAVFVPLGEWSSGSDSLLQTVLRRSAFAREREEHLKLLAMSGRLVLVMDGWNELDTASRKRASGQISFLQREFPELSIVISSRHADDAPISGPVVEIDTLSEIQQIEIARALRGSQGLTILDHAWRTPGVRELVAIPLYLTALLAQIPGEILPTTKEEVLRLFVAEHERAANKVEALREVIFGFHADMLTALAIEATQAGNTTIPVRRACAVVKEVEDRLGADGQITTAPQPTAVLEALVSHHLLVRSGSETGGGISFQHQQFQEWYAAFEVERLMRAAAGDPAVRQKLKTYVLNLRRWEEPILFSCERVSRDSGTGPESVSAAILDTMAIDPMLAAEMIQRSSDAVWSKIKDTIVAFVGRWHSSNKVDRAVRFMISTGRPEFAAQVWPLISDPNSQVHLAALRAGRRFRPSVLGDGVELRLGQLSEDLRAHIVSEIAHWSGMDGIELATRLAKCDASIKVKTAAIEALQFRRADRFVSEVLHTAPDEVLTLLARKGYVGEIADPGAAARLVRERQIALGNEKDPLKKLSAIVDAERAGISMEREISALIEGNDFPVSDQHARWNIDKAYKLCPDTVTRVLLHRLEAGLEIPFGAEDLLRGAGITVDEGPLVGFVTDASTPPRVAGAAACIVGPKTVGILIDRLAPVDREMKTSEIANPPGREEHQRLSNWISRSRESSLIEAVLSRSTTLVPTEISFLSDLVARHGREPHQEPLRLPEKLHDGLIAAIEGWTDALLASSEAEREHFANVARVIGRLAAPQLSSALLRLLATELACWRLAYEQLTEARDKRTRRTRSNALTSWGLQYRRAFVAIANTEVVEAMKAYLRDGGYCGFGVEAANVLKEIWDREHATPSDRPFLPTPNFSEVKARRFERQNKTHGRSPFADAIIAVIDDLIKSDSSEDSHRRALQLAKVAFSMPYGDRPETINKLLNLPQPLRLKQELLAVLVRSGEVIQADIVLDGIKGLIEEAKGRRWVISDHNWWEWEGWLELMPFSDRPMATFDALELIEANWRRPWRLCRLLSALAYAPGAEADEILAALAQEDEGFYQEHEWLAAVDKRGTPACVRLLLESICEGKVGKPGGPDVWTLSNSVARAMLADVDFRAIVYERYEVIPSGLGKDILERAITEVGDIDGLLVLVRSYASQGRFFDGALHAAIRRLALGEHPSANWRGAKEPFGVPVPRLRVALYAMAKHNGAEAGLAIACLNAIDDLRDEYGAVEGEPRHPDIDSSGPWPLLAA